MTTNRTLIIEVPSWQALQKTRSLVLNRFQIDVYGVTGRASDTDFSYNIYTDKRLNKAQLSTLQAFINGIIDTLRSF